MNQLVGLCCEGKSAVHKESASANRLLRWKGKSSLSKTQFLEFLKTGRNRLPSLYCRLYWMLKIDLFSTLRKKKSNLLPNFASTLYQNDERAVFLHLPMPGLGVLTPDSQWSGQPHPIPEENQGALSLFLHWGSRSSGCHMLLNNVYHGYKEQSA